MRSDQAKNLSDSRTRGSDLRPGNSGRRSRRWCARQRTPDPRQKHAAANSDCRTPQLTVTKRTESANPSSLDTAEWYVYLVVVNHGPSCKVQIPRHVWLGSQGMRTRPIPLRYGFGHYRIPHAAKRDLVITTTWRYTIRMKSGHPEIHLTGKCSDRIRNVTHGTLSLGTARVGFRLKKPWAEACKSPTTDWVQFSTP